MGFDVYGLHVWSILLLASLALDCHGQEIKLEPETKEVVKFKGENYFITCFLSNATETKWFRGAKEIPGGRDSRIHTEVGLRGVGRSLFFSMIQLEDQGNYTCSGVVNNTKHQESFSLFIYEPISFKDTPSTQVLEEGTPKGVVRCEVAGSPNPSIAWTAHDTDLVQPKFAEIGDGLVINNVTRNDERVYTCRAVQVSKISSDIKDKQINVTVLYKPQWSSADPTIVWAIVGGVKKVVCEVEANPVANITWFRNGKKMGSTTESNRAEIPVEFTEQMANDEYACQVVNRMGKLNRTFILKIGSKPGVPKTQVLARTSNSVTLEIEEPKEQQMPVLSYLAHIEKKGKKKDLKEVELPKGMTAHYVLKELEPRTDYLITVAAVNAAGHGDFAAPVAFKTLTATSAAPPNAPRSPLLLVLSFSIFTILSFHTS